MPKTKYGRWSVGFLSGFFILFFLFQVLVISGARGNNPDDSVNLVLFVPGMVMFFCGLASFISSLVAFFKYHDRSFAIYPVLVIGFFFSLMIVGEFVFPH